MTAISLDPNFPGMMQQTEDMVFILDSGETVTIEEGAIWDYSEPGGGTQIYLSDCDDPRAKGVCVCVDWSQIGKPPETIEERLEAAIMSTEAIREELNRLAKSR